MISHGRVERAEVYNIETKIKDSLIPCKQRFSSFRTLHTELLKNYSKVCLEILGLV